MGRGIHLTIDEWFYHWFSDETKYLDAVRFFVRILEICDKIALKKNSRLAHKFYQLDEDSGRWAPGQRNAVKFIKNAFLANSEKIFWIEDDQNFSEAINEKLPRKDIYIVEICFQTKDKIFITTDTTLYNNIDSLKNELAISPFLAKDFIHKYLSDEI